MADYNIDIIKKLMCLTGLKKEDLATRLEMSRPTLDKNIEKRDMDEAFVYKLEKIAGVTYANLELFLQNVNTTANTTIRQPSDVEQENKDLRKELSDLQKEIAATQKEYIELLKKINNQTS